MAKSLILTVLLLLAAGLAFGLPVGASPVSAGTPVTLGSTAAGTAAAWGGNITQVNLTINSSTLHWQGFYGNVTASLTLGSGGNAVKTWTVSTLRGQIYASTSNSVDFTQVSSTSVTRANVDSAFSFLSGANDATVNTGASDTANPAFSVGQYNITANSRPLITTFNNSASPAWQEVILAYGTPTVPSNLIFTGLLNGSGNAYNNASANFQIIVPSNQVGVSTPTTYYFYGEVQ